MQSEIIFITNGDTEILLNEPIIYHGSRLGGKKDEKIIEFEDEGENSDNGEDSEDDDGQKEISEKINEETIVDDEHKTTRVTKIKRTRLTMPPVEKDPNVFEFNHEDEDDDEDDEDEDDEEEEDDEDDEEE